MTASPDDMAPGAYRNLGLISNPFKSREPVSEGEEPGVKLIAHSATNMLVRAIDDAAGRDEPPPIWVEKAGNLPAAYYVGPLAETLGVLGSDEAATSVLPAYVPLDMMRIGRVRAVLSAVAEHVAGVDVDLTIAAWMRRMLASPDTDLPEYAPIAESDLRALDAALGSDPDGTVERYFGPCVAEREGVDDLEVLMRVATARSDSLETDPAEEEEATVDEAPEDVLSEIFTQPLGAVADTPELEEQDAEPDDGLPRADDLVAYVVAYASAHLSPVIARAFRAYRAQGTTSMSQELKVTKAPTKTLAALVRLATCRYRKVVVVFDRFEVWGAAPDDLKLKILGTLSQLRWAVRDGGLLVFLVSSGQAVELEEQFANATRVLWDMPDLVKVAGVDPSFDAEVAQEWLKAATIEGSEPLYLCEEPLARVSAASDGSLRDAAALLAAAIDDAVARGLTQLDDAAATAAIERTSSED